MVDDDSSVSEKEANSQNNPLTKLYGKQSHVHQHKDFGLNCSRSTHEI